MGFILGKERILHLREFGTTTWFPVACLVSNEITENTDFLETTTRENAGHRTFVPVDQDYEISFNAIMTDDEGTIGKVGLKQIREFKLNQTFLEWKLEALNKNFTDYGKCYIGNISEPAPVDGYIEFSGSLRGYGAFFDLTDLEPPTRPFLSLLIDSIAPSFNLSWTTSTDNLAVVGYEVRKSTTNDPTETIVVNNVTFYQDLSLEYFKHYSYNVRAYDAAGNYSPWSNKVLGYARLPSGQPTPEYKLHQDGTIKTYQDGTPKTYQ